jgi:hypothetical protein
VFRQFLDAGSRQTLDRIAETEHLPVADFAAKMAGHLGELEKELQKAFGRLPPVAGAGKKVVSMKQLMLAGEPQPPKKEPSSSSSPTDAAATEGEGTSGSKSSSKKKKKNKKPATGSVSQKE